MKITIHLLEWPKSQTVTSPNAAKNVEQQELLFNAGNNENCIATLENSLIASYKAKHSGTIRASNQTHRYLHK